jgi:tetratricopeptide (TPR) repeat protein
MRLMAALPVAAALLSLGPGEARADEYEAVVEQSHTLERDARYSDGVDLLARARADYPQDYTLALRLGWLSFLAGRYAEAERAYRDAVTLSGGQNPEAHSGLGWSLLRLGRKADAERAFETATKLDPADAVAAEGLALARTPDPPQVELYPAFALVGHAYPSHPYKSWAGTLSVGGAALFFRHLLVSATYRGSLFAFDPSAEPPRRATTSFSQHEGYFSLGWVALRTAAVAQFALVDDGSGFSRTSQHYGGVLRVSPWGDAVLAGSYSRYHDLGVGRGELSWRVPLGEYFWVRPAGAMQRTSDETLATAYATIGYDGARFGTWLGAKYGDEVRPAYLGAPFVLNVPERVIYGGWGGLRLSLGDRWAATLSLDIHVLERTDGLLPARTASMFTALGAARTL